MKRQVSLLGLLMVVASGAASAICPATNSVWQAASVKSQSNWYEFSPTGQELVKESGTLTGVALGVIYRCERWNLEAGFSELDGLRVYDGQTNSGIPVISESTIRQRHSHAQVMFSLTDSWQAGARIAQQTSWRNIASAYGANGYPERFNWRLFSFGTQLHTNYGRGQLTLAAWAGKEIDSSMRITLPGRDEASLSLGTIEQLEVKVGWRTQITKEWHAEADIGYRQTRLQQGQSSVIRRNGIPVGVAYQPHTLIIERPIAIRLGYQF